MSDAFDPYYTWLAIPPKDQPPNHYRLLGLELFEADPAVIENASDQRLGHLRTFQAGPHGPLSQRLLNEVAAARVCLLNAHEKAAYDVQLLRTTDSGEPAAETSSQERMLAELDRIFQAERRLGPPRRRSPVVARGAAVALLVLGLAAAAWVFWDSRSGPAPAPGRPAQFADPKRGAAPRQEAAPTRREISEPERRPKGERAKNAVASGEAAVPGAREDETPEARRDERAGGPTGVAEKPVREGQPLEAHAKDQAPPSISTVPSLAPGLSPVPDEEAQTKALKVAEDIYRGDYEQAKTPGQKQSLAARLLQQSSASELPPTDRYVLLRLARDVALRAGDSRLAFAAIERMAESFDIDGLAMKAEALPGLAKLAQGQSGHKAMAEQAVALAREAMHEDKLATAATLAKLAQSEASKARDKQAVEKARDLARDVQEAQKAFAEVEGALAVLKAQPDDPAANLAAGRYYALVKGDWDKGLGHLVKGSEGQLKALAEEDLKHAPPAWKPAPGVPPPDAVPGAATMKLAEAWWELGQQERGKPHEELLRRAGFWYEEAAAGPDAGRHFDTVDKRRQALARLKIQVAPKQILMNSLGMKFVLIPAGEFAMGSPPEDLEAARQRGANSWYLSRLALEIPRHRVRITRPFYLGVYEVTQAEYEALLGVNPSAFSATGIDRSLMEGKDTARNPVEMVDWNDATRFAQRLSSSPGEQAAGRRYRLPTEAEWEYACRAGTTTAWCSGDDVAGVSACSWHTPHGEAKTHPVGQKGPNAWGLFDMHGNVMEWCADWLSAQTYSLGAVVDPQGPASGTERVFRGGCCNSPADHCRSAFRKSEGGACDYRFHALGFRLALDGPARPGAKPAARSK